MTINPNKIWSRMNIKAVKHFKIERCFSYSVWLLPKKHLSLIIQYNFSLKTLWSFLVSLIYGVWMGINVVRLIEMKWLGTAKEWGESQKSIIRKVLGTRVAYRLWVQLLHICEYELSTSYIFSQHDLVQTKYSIALKLL